MQTVVDTLLYSALRRSFVGMIAIVVPLRGDKEFVMMAGNRNWWAFKYASNKLKSDGDVVVAAVKWFGSLLQHVSAMLRDDEVVVVVAAKNYRRSLEYDSNELKDDKKIVMVAMKTGGYYAMLPRDSETTER